MFVCMNSESMLGGENSGEMPTIIMPFSKPEFYLNSGIPAVFGPGIPVEFQLELSGIPAVYRQQFQQNSGGMPVIIPAEFRLEFQCYTGGMPPTIPAEFQWNTGGMPAIIPAEFRLDFRGIPANFLARCGEKQGTAGVYGH